MTRWECNTCGCLSPSYPVHVLPEEAARHLLAARHYPLQAPELAVHYCSDLCEMLDRFGYDPVLLGMGFDPEKIAAAKPRRKVAGQRRSKTRYGSECDYDEVVSRPA